ncbi:MAG: polyphosphate kinase 1 [Chitinophagales bacterium]|nr:polyphosphate kinase 1 [Chitinophagaceae bacterium]MCB9063813.1 polyphosphate kinase 1 [Chitinophagales bacterium]
MKSSRRTIARDISWLSFNARVLQEASDPNNYIYERLKFIGIFSNNQDEFFRVRVATLSRMVRLGKAARVHLEQNPGKILDKIQQLVIYQQTVFDETFSEIISELEKKNIYIKTERQLSKEQKEFVTGYFNDKVRTQIIPLMMESIPEMPYLRDKSIYLACVLGNTKNPMLQRYALIEIPRTVLPRFIIMPSEPGQHDIILLEDIIRYNLPNLFAPFGFNRFLGYIIKVTRDAELDVDNDISTNVIDELEKGLKNRKKGRATRFVFDRNIDGNLLNYLTKRLQLSKNDNLIPGGRIHNFKDFMEFPSSVFDDLQSRPKPFVHPFLHQPCRIMEVMEKQDIMLNFPYHSFDPIIDLLREAAIDPFVQSIKITCYRLAKDSKIINALINAVRNGKSVTVVLELWARFDEEANLKWKERLEEEGVNVLLGIPNMKVHAKICVIKKREFKSTKQYAFISTGNFNESTAKVYGDTCLLTTNRSFIADINRVFTVLENSKPSFDLLQKCTVLPVSPINMRDYFVAMIDKEIKAAKKGHEASIIIKLNSLVDEILIGKLYDAAKVGVDVKLIIRSNCCTVSEQKAFKKPIYAISIVDGYLEHSRIFVFHNGGDPKVFISSADWMVRNLDHRIEVACPILDKNIKQELIDILNIQLSGNVKARILDNEQKNEYVHREEGEPIVRAQEAIYEYLYNKQYKKR